MVTIVRRHGSRPHGRPNLAEEGLRSEEVRKRLTIQKGNLLVVALFLDIEVVQCHKKGFV